MELTLSENIRTFRKQKKMTQEKLAEVLGVTVGAVYKWENGLSLPELSLIVEMADFFDTSVDVLLGYRMKDNRPDSIGIRLTEYCKTLDPRALAEAEKALGKYPHSFRLVYECARIYCIYGSSNRDPALLRRALDLLDQAIVLLPQNKDPRINEASVNADKAVVLFSLDEREKSIELMKQNNAGGCFSGEIGIALAVFMDRPEEAVPFLTESLVRGLSELLSAVVGYVFVYRSRGNWTSALEIAQWGIDVISGMKTENESGYPDKIQAEMLAILACVQAKTGLTEASRESLKKAGIMARAFDSMPNYTLNAMRFGDDLDQTAAFDAFGPSASKSIAQLITLLDGGTLADEWKEIAGHGE